MKLPEKEAAHVFVLHSHITYLVSRKIVETYGLRNVYAIRARGYVPPVPDDFIPVTSPEMMKRILETEGRKSAFIPHSPAARRFFNHSATEHFSDFYYIEEGTLAYKKSMPGFFCDHEKLVGCFSVYENGFPDFKNKVVPLGESIFGYYRYELKAAGLLILEESRWLNDPRSYLTALERFLAEYSRETHELPLFVSLRRLHDSVRQTIDGALKMLDAFAISYMELPPSVVKESFIYGTDMPIYYYQSSLGMYAKRMGKNAICYK